MRLLALLTVWSMTRKGGIPSPRIPAQTSAPGRGYDPFHDSAEGYAEERPLRGQFALTECVRLRSGEIGGHRPCPWHPSKQNVGTA